MTNLHETDRLVERLSSALKGYDEAVEWHSYRPHDVNREREQHAAAAVLADELRTALDALTAMGGKAEPVVVKPLEWRSEPPYSVSRPHAGVHYAVEMWEGGRATLSGNWCGRSDFDSPALAKAAAQADYETRILSALSSNESNKQ